MIDIVQKCNLLYNPEAISFFKRKSKGRDITFQEVMDLYIEQNGYCALCDDKLDLDSKKTHIDHILPKAKGGMDWLHNLQLVCARCNYAKRDTGMKEFVLMCVKIENKFRHSGLINKDEIMSIVKKRWKKEQKQHERKSLETVKDVKAGNS